MWMNRNNVHGNVSKQHQIHQSSCHDQSRSARQLVKRLFEGDALLSTFETTRFNDHEKNDPIFSHLGTLAINSINSHTWLMSLNCLLQSLCFS